MTYTSPQLIFGFYHFVLGVIQFGIEADETKERHVTAEDVKSETPKYSEEIGTIKSGASMMTMSSASDAGYASTERRKRTKSDSAASAGGTGGAEFSFKEENVQGSDFTNQGYMRFVACPLAVAVNKSPSVFIFIRALDDLLRLISTDAFLATYLNARKF